MSHCKKANLKYRPYYKGFLYLPISLFPLSSVQVESTLIGSPRSIPESPTHCPTRFRRLAPSSICSFCRDLKMGVFFYFCSISTVASQNDSTGPNLEASQTKHEALPHFACSTLAQYTLMKKKKKNNFNFNQT